MKKILSFLVVPFLLWGCGSRASISNGGSAVEQKTYKWTMAMTWPKNLPGLGTGAVELAENIEAMSGGRMRIKVYGAGELFPALELFDQVKNGTVQMGHGAAYYWVGKEPAAQFFTSVPFGLNTQQMNAWLYSGGGLELWREVYRPHGIIPFPAGATGIQMTGWFNREINTPEDLKGLKMRIPGLAGVAFTDNGGSAETIPGGELYQALEKGTIDAVEWVGPYNDTVMGFPEVAKYYYYPGWHEPGSILELIINQEAWDELPADLQAIVKAAAAQSNISMLSEYEANNPKALADIKAGGEIELRSFNDETLEAFKTSVTKELEKRAKENELFARVYESFKTFQSLVEPWHEISEKAYSDIQ